MRVLGIDTSGNTASCAICTENELTAESICLTRRAHSQMILPMVKQLLSGSGLALSDIDCFAAVSGPGSYTGLRIGIAAVKGMAYGLDRECAGVSALETLAYNFSGTKSRICAVMHARQELVYAAFFETKTDGTVLRLENDEIISERELLSRLEAYSENEDVICAGDYAVHTVQTAQSERITAAPCGLVLPRASSLCFAAMKKGFSSPDELNADYMQITKAEKDQLQETKG